MSGDRETAEVHTRRPNALISPATTSPNQLTRRPPLQRSLQSRLGLKPERRSRHHQLQEVHQEVWRFRAGDKQNIQTWPLKFWCRRRRGTHHGCSVCLESLYEQLDGFQSLVTYKSGGGLKTVSPNRARPNRTAAHFSLSTKANAMIGITFPAKSSGS